MTMDYLSAIKPFALQVFDPMNQPTKSWRWVDSFNVLRSLLRLLDNPDSIHQSCFGLCGQAAFLRCWAYRDPVAVANFTLDLFKNGSGKIGDASSPNGDLGVSPNNDLLRCSWMYMPDAPDSGDNNYADWKWGVGNPITEAVWMIAGSLANVTDNLIAELISAGANLGGLSGHGKFIGLPASNEWTLALPENIETWLKKANCHSSVVNNMDVWDKATGPHSKTVANDARLTNYFDPVTTDIILCINSNMFVKGTTTPSTNANPAQFSFFPDHYVMLTAPIRQSGNTLTVPIWTWGAYYTLTISVQDFDDNYYGSIVAISAAPRRTLTLGPLTGSAIRNPRIYFTPDQVLHFNWNCADGRVEWFELQRMGPGGVENKAGTGPMAVRDILQRVQPTPGTAEYQVTLDSSYWQEPADTLYNLAACNGALKPFDYDPASYNHYDDTVPCNLPQGNSESGALCASQTTHVHVVYNQLDFKRSALADATLTCAGVTAGYCHADGRMEIVAGGATVQVGNKPGTPLKAQKIGVWLEYFYAALASGAYALSWMSGGYKGVEVTLGSGFYAGFSTGGTASLTLDPATADADLPGMVLKAVLMLEHAHTGSWPDWIFPAFLSQVGVVQASAAVTPDGCESLYSSYRACEVLNVYDAGWAAGTNSRSLQVGVSKPANPGLAAAVFLQFDKPVQPGSVRLQLAGQTPDGKSVSIPVAVTASADGSYFWGWFQPANTWASSYSLQLVVQANRLWPNAVLGSLVGDTLDANPATVALVDPRMPRKLAFQFWDPGGDTNHAVVIGYPGLYACQASMMPDALEQGTGNNTFVTATQVSLVVPEAPHQLNVSLSDQKSYSALNFHDSQDVDYFDVSYQCPSYDDTDAANKPHSGGTNGYLGLSSGHTPPVLSCLVVPADCRCIDLAAYKCDALGRALVTSEAKSPGIAIDSPTRTLGAKRGYFVVQNHDGAAQGAFAYSLRLTYTSAFDSLSVNTGALAYTQGLTTVQRQHLGQLFDRIDLPRPPEDGGKVIQVRDPSQFITGFEKFLLDPAAGKLLARAGTPEGRTAVGDGLHFLGQVAQSYGFTATAERLYTESANRYSRQGAKAKAVAVLQDLVGVYQLSGDKAGLTRVKARIRRLETALGVVPHLMRNNSSGLG